MKHDQVITKIFALSILSDLSFSDKGNLLQKAIDSCSQNEILVHLDFAGAIPEHFEHDSTEEKLFAKYCDILMARALSELGFTAHASDERGNAADVYAKSDSYELVGDAKAFRLSRTARAVQFSAQSKINGQDLQDEQDKRKKKS